MENREITIIEITEEEILFDDGSYIRWEHFQDCCEKTYADLYQIVDCIGMKFKTPLQLEKADDYGFRFGSNRNNMVFVPCYSEQNGHYSAWIELYHFDAEMKTITEYDFEGQII